MIEKAHSPPCLSILLSEHPSLPRGRHEGPSLQSPTNIAQWPERVVEYATHNFLLLGLVGKTCAAQGAATALETIEMLLHPLNILQTELGLDDLHVTQWVDVALYVDDFGIVKRTDHLEDTVDRAYMGQEGVTETRAGRRAL